QRRGQRRGKRRFHASRDRIVDVGVRRRQAAELVGRAAIRAGYARDLVGEFVVEQRDAGQQTVVAAVHQRDFLGQRLFRLQVWVAVHIAAAAGGAPVRQSLPHRRSPKAGGHAALERPVVGQLPD